MSDEEEKKEVVQNSHGGGVSQVPEDDPTVNNPNGGGISRANKKCHGVPKLKRKAPHGRGIKDAKTIMDTVMNNWDDLVEDLQKLSDEDQNTIKEHFNSLIAGEEDLGDLLFGEMNDFKQRIEFLQEDDYDTYAKEIENEEIIIVDMEE